MSKLALDLGTRTGWALGRGDGGEYTISGRWDLSPDRYESASMRFIKLETSLNKLHEADSVTLLGYEEVHKHRGTAAAHIYGGLLATVQVWAEKHKIPYKGVPVQTIKKFATGKGNADKAAMIAAAEALGFMPLDDNEADAIHLLRFLLMEGK